MMPWTPVSSRGFTLAELLLSLVILGVIATFTIPKILSANVDSKRKAVFREIIAAYSQATWEGYSTGAMAAGNCSGCSATEYPFNAYFQTRINYIKQCTQAVPGGCYVGTCFAPTEPGQVLASGASTCGLSNKIPTVYDNFFIDWDGPTNGPGVNGTDQLRVRICLDAGCPNGQRPGTVIAYPDATNRTMFEGIFQGN